MRYKLNANSYSEAQEELIRKVKCGKIPEGRYRLVDYMSMSDYEHHWWAEKLS